MKPFSKRILDILHEAQGQEIFDEFLERLKSGADCSEPLAFFGGLTSKRISDAYARLKMQDTPSDLKSLRKALKAHTRAIRKLGKKD